MFEKDCYPIMPPLNLQFYTGTDNYSDDDIEERILNYIVKYEPEQYSDIFLTDADWAVFYHLTPVRKSLLNWFSFKPESSLLEIGAGMGGLTFLFCEKCKHVTAVELSKRRATAIQSRCRNFNNLDIMVGDFTQMQFNKEYDYITLIGVLEYQGLYGSDNTPPHDFIKALKKLLAPGGKLIIAIENKYGMKYWTGEGEDHTGVPFDSINDYTLWKMDKMVRTFDKQELTNLLKDSGFNEQKFYYPQPDYKLPQVILTDKYITSDSLSQVRPLYYSAHRTNDLTIIIDEQKIREPIINNGVFPFFANSFLVECSIDDANFDDTQFAIINNYRKEKYRTITRFDGIRFHKYAENTKAQLHIENCISSFVYLKKKGISIVPHQYDCGIISTPFMQYSTALKHVVHLLKERNINEAKKIFDKLFALILHSSDAEGSMEKLKNKLPDDNRDYDFGTILKNVYWDMTLNNCFYDNNKLIIYDQEWVAHDLPASFVLFRAIVQLYNANPFLEDFCPIRYWKENYGLEELWTVYENLTESIIQEILSHDIVSLNKITYLPPDTVQKNILLLQNGRTKLAKLEFELDAIYTSKTYRIVMLLKQIVKNLGLLFIIRLLLSLKKDNNKPIHQ